MPHLIVFLVACAIGALVLLALSFF